MKTVNPNIFIFDTLNDAEKFFNKQPAPVALLSSKYKSYFVDTAHNTKEAAIKAWPSLYAVVKEKV